MFSGHAVTLCNWYYYCSHQNQLLKSCFFHIIKWTQGASWQCSLIIFQITRVQKMSFEEKCSEEPRQLKALLLIAD